MEGVLVVGKEGATTHPEHCQGTTSPPSQCLHRALGDLETRASVSHSLRPYSAMIDLPVTLKVI